MAGGFTSFVVLAGMRTGSNFLEENLNQLEGVCCLGEVFNPGFIGHAGKTELLGISIAERDQNPGMLLEKMKHDVEGLSGFRLFHDHDERVFDAVMNDRSCAKIVLSRNPVDTYISMEIVRQTGQWRLGDMKNAKSARAEFDRQRFRDHLQDQTAFQRLILEQLQVSGQTAYYLDYEDVADANVMAGMARYLGSPAESVSVSKKTKKQNPGSISDRVSNFDEMEKSLADIDFFSLNRTPNFEPRRGPMIPSYIAAPSLGLLFAPIPGGPGEAVLGWMAALDRVETDDLITGFTQKSLRQWKRRFKRHISFTVVTHPVERLFRSFCDKIAVSHPHAFHEIRSGLMRQYSVPIFEEAQGIAEYGDDELAAAFKGFATFMKGNLNGQTNIRVDPAWATQGAMIHGFSNFMPPDHVLRKERLHGGLAFLACDLGREVDEVDIPVSDEVVDRLKAIYNDEIENAVRAAYQKDYMNFGYGSWA